MALIVEDGTCPDGANVYVSLSDANAYAVARGLWTATTDATEIAEREVALIRAADWLNGLQWKGAPVDVDRVMAWPRDNVKAYGTLIPSTSVPYAVAVANIEAAVEIVGGSDLLEAQEVSGSLKSKSMTVGPISESYTYGSASTTPKRPAITARLRAYLSSMPEDEDGGSALLSVGRG